MRKDEDCKQISNKMNLGQKIRYRLLTKPAETFNKNSLLYNKCKKSNTDFIYLILRQYFYKIFYNKNLLLHQNARIKGVENIHTKGELEIGLSYIGFIHKTDVTFLNINGKLLLAGNYIIGRGCRFDIGKNAVVSIGDGGYINANTRVIIMHKLTIGNHCVISWDCQFLDEDFHHVDYMNKKLQENQITIGNHVWIGCGAKIYKGSFIADGCIVASDSIIKGKFYKKNTMIAGNPARIIKEEVEWK